MPLITVGTSTKLIIKIPSKGDVHWADDLRAEAWQKISDHDHTGGGKGAQIATAAIADDAVTPAKCRDLNVEDVTTVNQVTMTFGSAVNMVERISGGSKTGFTIPADKGGKYMINAYLVMESSASSVNNVLSFKIDGNTIWQIKPVLGAVSTEYIYQMNFVTTLAAGSVVTWTLNTPSTTFSHINAYSVLQIAEVF